MRNLAKVRLAGLPTMFNVKSVKQLPNGSIRLAFIDMPESALDHERMLETEYFDSAPDRGSQAVGVEFGCGAGVTSRPRRQGAE